MPEPIHAFGIFILITSAIMFAWRGDYFHAFWFFALGSFHIYLEFWKRSKSKSDK
jgi:hypothetical protein